MLLLLLLLLSRPMVGKMGRMVLKLVMMVMEIVRYERQLHRGSSRRSSHHGAGAIRRRCHRTIASPAIAETTG
uniref:Putative secreted protein n=1 Tax=Anopheles marajoara TaxID=58244 RepID=A0A2M4CDL2_9DIPT